MTEEDEEFTRIEREAAMRKEAVRATVSKRAWVGLTAEDRWEIIYATERDERTTVMEMVEAKLKEKNA